MSATPSRVVERLLAEQIGLDSSSVGAGLIARGIHARMTSLGLRSKAEYERILIEHRDELQSLVEEVVVPESWFFRDDRPFEVLANFAREAWRINPDRPPLTALSLPCAGGEEPYSIAMTLLEVGLPCDRFRIDAVDISTRSLARAIAGVYGSNAFRGSASSHRSKYFREQNGSFTLDLAVRSTVRFHLGNLLDPALFAGRPPFDVVFCRNLLIYLDDDSRSRASAALDRLIVDGGLLFLGHADRLDRSDKSPFVATGDKGGFAYRKGKPEPKPVKAISKPSGAAPRREKARESRIPPAAAGRVEPEKTKPEKRNVEATLAESSASILDRGSALADLGRYDEATALVEGSIRDGGSSAGAFFLLGLIAQAAGDRERAEAHFIKAIYLDAQHDEALMALALLAGRKGDIAAEAAYRRRAQRVLARKAVP
jgi:chemotaxis protein methyltransferase WspC